MSERGSRLRLRTRAVSQQPGTVIATGWMDRVLTAVQALSTGTAAVIAAVSFTLVVLVDVVTGPELSLLLGHVVVVLFVAWSLGRPWSDVFAASAAMSMLAVVLVDGDIRPAVAVGNACFRFLILELVVAGSHALRRMLAVLELAATEDPLTGLRNRRGFDPQLERELAIRARDGTPLTLVAFDLDGLKAVNDDLGHAAGDRLIVGFADTLRRHIRRTDIVARVGGDEFLLLLPNTDTEQVVELLARIEADAGCPPVSAGAVAARPGVTAAEFQADADDALYADKRSRSVGDGPGADPDPPASPIASAPP